MVKYVIVFQCFFACDYQICDQFKLQGEFLTTTVFSEEVYLRILKNML